MTDEPPMLAVNDLHVVFPQGRRLPLLRAVDGVDFTVGERETLGVVGESGSGKSTIGRAILGLVPINQGSVRLLGDDITHATIKHRRAISSKLQVVFQDPYSSLNPARTVGQSLSEMLRPQGIKDGRTARKRAASLLEKVGLPTESLDRYPAHFSGGQRQRIAIARALMTSPRLLICDEIVSALDLSVQAQVLNLMADLQSGLGMSYVFISHDLAVVRHISHRIAVLYKGQIMETGEAATVYERPAHPYTRLLIDAEPRPDPDLQRQRHTASVKVAARATVGEAGCPFATRCPAATEVCSTIRPELELTSAGTLAACHHWREFTPRTRRDSADDYLSRDVHGAPRAADATDRDIRTISRE
jgi:oligopeptide/dipeptide ABC transporter ATP-binding protein